MVRKIKPSEPGLLGRMNFRTILHSKLQFLAVILITALAMTLFVGLSSNALSINNRVNELYEGSNMADIWTTTASYDSEDLPSIKEIVGSKGMVEERFLMPAKLQGFEATALISKSLPKINKPSKTDNKAMDNFFIIDKRLLDTQKQGSEIRWTDENGEYLEIPVKFSISSFLESLSGIKVEGVDKSLLEILNLCATPGKENILNNPYLTINLKITGTMEFAENVQNSQMNNTSFLLSEDYFKNEALKIFSEHFTIPELPSLDDPNYFLIKQLQNVDIVNTSRLLLDSYVKPNQYVIKLNDSASIGLVKDDIQAYFKAKENNNLIMAIDLSSLSSNVTIQNDISQAKELSYIFPTIFFLVAILVVLTTISQIILKERIQIGTMKALGVSRARIVAHYMALASDVVLIGVVVGIIAGPFIIPMIMNQKYDILYSLPKISYTIAIKEMLISTVAVILVTSLVTFLIVFKEASLKPAMGMRPKEVRVAKAIKNEVKATKNSIPIRMALRNIRLNLSKSLMVIMGICGCTALLVCGFGIDDTLKFGVNSDIHNFYSSDLYASYSSYSSKLDSIEALDGVASVEEYSMLPATLSNENKSYQSLVYVIDDNSKFFNIDNYELTDKVIISNKISKELGLKKGDKIKFQAVGMSFEGEVGLVLDVFYQHGIYINASAKDYSRLSSKLKTNAWINVRDGYDHLEVLNEINSLDGISNAKTYQENVDLINSYMSSISLMTLAVKVFAILLAVVVLYNLSLLNFKERERDIATLKVLGFSKYEIGASLFYESLILSAIGIFFGLFLGLPMEILVLFVNQTPLVEFLYTVDTMSYIISLLITLGTAAVVNYFLTYKIKGVKMVESLKSVE